MKTLIFAMFIASPFIGISQNSIFTTINKLLIQNIRFKDVHLLNYTVVSQQESTINSINASNGTFFKLDTNTLKLLMNIPENYIKLKIPNGDNTNTELLLFQQSIFSSNFIAYSSADKSTPLSYIPGAYYRGIINGDSNSIASLSIFNNTIIGMFSNKTGNYIIGQVKSMPDYHVVYKSKHIDHNFGSCEMRDDNIPYTFEQLQSSHNLRDINDCVQIYIEIDYDIVNDKGSAVDAINYIGGLMNQVITLFDNENINVTISEILAWETTSPYSGNNSAEMLISFQNYTGPFNGDLAQLISYQASGGIAAGFAGICANNPDNSKSFSSINDEYNNLPIYSWSVGVVTHELGHLMGSRHTHACVWNGNGTQIDDCGNELAQYDGDSETEPEGGDCYDLENPILPNSGTIMSYCHGISGIGINFSNGFGTQPGNVIRNSVNSNNNCLTACCILPDLKIINQYLNPTSITAGQSVLATFIEKNIGSTSSIPNHVSFHLSSNNILTPGQNGDIFLTDYFVNQSLATNQQTNLLSKNIVIPSSTPTGTYYIFFSADGSQSNEECDELNNFASVILNVTGIPQFADLIIQNPSVSPTSILPGQQGTVYCKNKNQGTATAGTSLTAVWLSQNQVFDGAPTDINLNADISIPQLTPGQISNLLSHSITIPSGTACGTWYIMFGADALSEVDEGANENNNQLFIPITISCALMCNNDYSCGPPEPPSLTIYSTCTNTSCSTVGATPPSPNINFFCGGNQYQSGRYDDDVWFKILPLSSDQITITVVPTSNLSTFDPVIGLYQGPCLTPTQLGCADLYPAGYTEQLVFTPNPGIEYRIRVFGYNIGYGSGNFNICVTTTGTPDPPDLIISNPILSDYTICAGDNINVTYQISNIGGAIASASTVKYYISSNSTYSTNDELLGSTSISSLAIGETQSKSKTLNIPEDINDGGWYILIVADANNDVEEGVSGENNNTFPIATTILDCGDGLPDLVINYISHTPININPGQVVFVNFEAENIGDHDAESSYIGIFISEDNIFDPQYDEFLDNMFQSPLDQGETDNDILNFEVPNCYPCGTYYIFIIIDYQNLIVESNNNNNYDSFQMSVSNCPACTFSVPPTGINFGSAGGSSNFSVSTAQCCPWTASTNDDWVTLIQDSGIGPGTVTYMVGPCSDGEEREATISVAGQSHQISQNCSEVCGISQTFTWATQAGSSNQHEMAKDVECDALGNLYMTGTIQGMTNFGNGIILTPPSNAPDIFVSKHSSTGVAQWAVNYGTTNQEEGLAITVDSDGNVYVVGYFDGMITFGNTTLTSNNGYAAFIIKLNTSGVLQWAKKINPSYTGVATDVTVDLNNNIFVIGDLNDYSNGIINKIFISKYNNTGTQLWYDIHASDSNIKNISGVATDGFGNILVCGRYRDMITLGSFTLTTSIFNDKDGFIAKLNSNGTVVWANKLSSPGVGNDWLRAVSTDTSNNIYVIGEVDSSAIIGNITIPLPKGIKFIVIKYNPEGDPLWAKASTSGFQGNQKGICLGLDNNLYFSSSFGTSMQLDSFSIASNGGLSGFFGGIDSNGKIVLLKGLDGSGWDAVWGITIDLENKIYIAGEFESVVQFDNIILTSYGNTDIFIAGFNQCDLFVPEIEFIGDPVVCSGETLLLSTEFCASNNYQWIFNTLVIPGANNPTYLVTEPGEYKVKVFENEECQATSDSVLVASQGSYTFTGTGDWSLSSNWSNNTVPPEPIEDCYEIIIDHIPGGQCVLHTDQAFAPLVNVIIRPGKTFIILPE